MRLAKWLVVGGILVSGPAFGEPRVIQIASCRQGPIASRFVDVLLSNLPRSWEQTSLPCATRVSEIARLFSRTPVKPVIVITDRAGSASLPRGLAVVNPQLGGWPLRFAVRKGYQRGETVKVGMLRREVASNVLRDLLQQLIPNSDPPRPSDTPTDLALALMVRTPTSPYRIDVAVLVDQYPNHVRDEFNAAATANGEFEFVSPPTGGKPLPDRFLEVDAASLNSVGDNSRIVPAPMFLFYRAEGPRANVGQSTTGARAARSPAGFFSWFFPTLSAREIGVLQEFPVVKTDVSIAEDVRPLQDALERAYAEAVAAIPATSCDEHAQPVYAAFLQAAYENHLCDYTALSLDEYLANASAGSLSVLRLSEFVADVAGTDVCPNDRELFSHLAHANGVLDRAMAFRDAGRRLLDSMRGNPRNPRHVVQQAAACLRDALKIQATTTCGTTWTRATYRDTYSPALSAARLHAWDGRPLTQREPKK